MYTFRTPLVEISYSWRGQRVQIKFIYLWFRFSVFSKNHLTLQYIVQALKLQLWRQNPNYKKMLKGADLGKDLGLHFLLTSILTCRVLHKPCDHLASNCTKWLAVVKKLTFCLWGIHCLGAKLKLVPTQTSYVPAVCSLWDKRISSCARKQHRTVIMNERHVHHARPCVQSKNIFLVCICEKDQILI